MNSIERMRKQKIETDIKILRKWAGEIDGSKKRLLNRVADELEKSIQEK